MCPYFYPIFDARLARRENYFLILVSGLVMLAIVGSSFGADRIFAQASGPSLTIPQAIPAMVGSPVTVPVDFRTGGAAVGSVVFSIDFDEECLGFDARDNNNDGQPDSVHFSKPAAFRGSVSYAADDLDGELDFVIADYSPPIAALPDTDGLVTLEFTPLCTPTTAPISVAVAFSDAPAISFGAPNGNDLTGSGSDGSVEIAKPVTPTTTATATSTATFTPTTSAPATATPTTIPISTPTNLNATPEPVRQPWRAFLPLITR